MIDALTHYITAHDSFRNRVHNNKMYQYNVMIVLVQIIVRESNT